MALNFEAAVAGGIPVIKTLREALAANQIRRVYGILNGTCNYILTQMQEEHRSFDDVLEEAQAKGYAEADPTFDIDGFDTAHKLALLTSLASAPALPSSRSTSRASDTITQADIEAADELGYRIKLLGVALMTESGIEQRVHPAMVPKHSAIAEVSGVTNCRRDRWRFRRQHAARRSRRRRASRRPRRWSSDILDIARGAPRRPSACRPPSSSRTSAPSSAGTRAPTTCASPSSTGRAPWPASPGAWASAGCRWRASCSGARAGRSPASTPAQAGAPTPVILITHETTEEAIRAALEAIDKDGKWPRSRR